MKQRTKDKKMKVINKKMKKTIKLAVVALLAAVSLSAVAEMVWVRCHKCNGRGLLCSTCNNTGRRKCYICNGTGWFFVPGLGNQVCTGCEGGTRMCMDCVMTSVGCPDCNARGGRFVER